MDSASIAAIGGAASGLSDAKVTGPPMTHKYFKIEDDVHVTDRWFLGDFHSTDFQDRRRFGICEPCRGIFTVDPGDGGSAPNFSLTAFGLPIAALPVAETISKIAADDVHLVPVRIKGHGEFRFVQILRALDCVDESRSEFESYEDDAPVPSRRGEYSSFHTLVVDQAKIPANAHMFHIAKWRVRPIVSEAVRSALMEAGDLGVKFLSASPTQVTAS